MQHINIKENKQTSSRSVPQTEEIPSVNACTKQDRSPTNLEKMFMFPAASSQTLRTLDKILRSGERSLEEKATIRNWQLDKTCKNDVEFVRERRSLFKFSLPVVTVLSLAPVLFGLSEGVDKVGKTLQAGLPFVLVLSGALIAAQLSVEKRERAQNSYHA